MSLPHFIVCDKYATQVATVYVMVMSLEVFNLGLGHLCNVANAQQLTGLQMVIRKLPASHRPVLIYYVMRYITDLLHTSTSDMMKVI